MAKYVVYVDFGLKAIVCWLERIMTLVKLLQTQLAYASTNNE